MSRKTIAVVEDARTTGGASGAGPTAKSEVESGLDGRALPESVGSKQFSLFSQSTLNLSCVIALWTILSIFYSFVFIVTRNSSYSLDYEGHVFWACDKLLHFQNIYAPELLNQQPFAITMYNPLFMAFGALCNHLAGNNNLGCIRSISVLSTIFCFIVFYRILRDRCGIGALHAAAATGFFASYVPVFYWSHLARVDMLGLALAIWGVERFGVALERRNLKGEALALGVSILLFVCAYFTKQQYLIFPVAASIFCFAERRVKLGVVILSTFFGASVLIGALLELVTGGYLAHLTYARGLAWEWETLSLSLIPFLTDAKTVSIAVILLASLFVRGSASTSTRLDKLAMILIAIALPLALYTMGLRGAFHNHLLSIEFAMCLLIATRLPRFSPSITTFVVVLALLATSTTCRAASDFAWRLTGTAKNPEALKILKQLDVKGKRVLFEDASVALALGAEPDFVDVTTLFNTTGGAAEKTDVVCASIERKEYAAIMINSRDNLYEEIIWPKRVVRAIKKDYRKLDCTFSANGERQKIYIPR